MKIPKTFKIFASLIRANDYETNNKIKNDNNFDIYNNV